jgi:hypothetical protein
LNKGSCWDRGDGVGVEVGVVGAVHEALVADDAAGDGVVVLDLWIVDGMVARESGNTLRSENIYTAVKMMQ